MKIIIKNIKKIKGIFKKLKIEKKRVVLCHGVFDVLHLGHIKHFENAKKFGDILVVSVTSDRYVNKGIGRPHFSLEHRMLAISSLSIVDFVVPSDYPTAIKNIELIKPNFYVKGPDYKNTKDKHKQEQQIDNNEIYELLKEIQKDMRDIKSDIYMIKQDIIKLNKTKKNKTSKIDIIDTSNLSEIST